MMTITAFAKKRICRLTFAPLWGLVMCQCVLGQGSTLERTINHNGISRDYLLFVPSTYTAEKSYPLVFMLHGFGTNASFGMSQSELNDVAETNGFLVAYPNAVSGDWNGGEDNVDFVATGLLTDVAAEYSVDPARVYSTGWSQGGVLSYALAATRPETFAAVAAVAGTPYAPAWLPEKPSSPFPVLHIHGTADPLAPYDGGAGIWGGTFPPVPEFTL